MKKEFLPPKTKRRLCRQTGQIQWMPGIFLTLFLIVLCSAKLKELQFGTTALYMEDALAASNLASALIDVKEYGQSHTVKIADPERSYQVYLKALGENLNLDENGLCANQELIAGAVTVDLYMIYNVEGEEVTFLQVDKQGCHDLGKGRLGEVYAPDGSLIEHTSIYSQLSFEVKGFGESTYTARKGKLVDIVGESPPENETEDEKRINVNDEG